MKGYLKGTNLNPISNNLQPLQTQVPPIIATDLPPMNAKGHRVKMELQDF